MINTLIIFLAVILLAGLLHFEKVENRKGLLPAKMTLSSLFVLALLVQPHPIQSYYLFLLIGLLFCFMGDLCLALPKQRMFLLGLVAFLIGHIFYILGFFSVASTSQWTWVGSLIVILVSGMIYFWLKPHLGSFNLPVLFYVIVISLMVSGAWSILGDSDLVFSGRIMVFAGAITFYFSDVFVARDRFLRKQLLNRLAGLPMYYTGQFLLAFSVGFLDWSSCG